MSYPGGAKRIRMSTKRLDEATNSYIATDPTTLVLTVEDPDGTETEYLWPAGTIIRSAAGEFYQDITCPLAGTWAASADATGALIAGGQANWTVLASLVDA